MRQPQFTKVHALRRSSDSQRRWRDGGGEGPYTAKGEPRCSPPAGSKDNKTFVLSGDRGGRAERSEGAVGRQGEPRGGGCRGVRAALLPFFYLFLGIQGFASCSSGRSPTNTQPLGHWTSALRSKRLPICRARPHSWGVGDVGPRDVCRAAEGGLAREGKAVRWQARREAHVWGRREFRSQHQAANAVLHLTLGSPC